jgi:hypothetical protein
MLNAQLVNKTSREDSTRKSSSENRSEFAIETTNTHILKLEIGLDDGVWWRALRWSLQLDGGISGLETADLRLGSKDATGVSRWGDGATGLCTRFFKESEIDAFDRFDGDFQGEGFEVYSQLLSWGEDLIFVGLHFSRFLGGLGTVMKNFARSSESNSKSVR